MNKIVQGVGNRIEVDARAFPSGQLWTDFVQSESKLLPRYSFNGRLHGIIPHTRSSDESWWNQHYLVARYIGGLHSDTKEQLALQSIGYLNEAISTAKTIEEQINNRYKKQYSHRTTWEQGGTSRKNSSSIDQNSLDANTSTATKGKQVDMDAMKDTQAC